MTAASAIPNDPLAALVPAEQQRLAAHMAQDAFARLFRLTVDSDTTALAAAATELATACRQWCRAGDSDDARALRLALLASGMDQWGLAYSQAFGLAALPGLSALLGSLRSGLDAVADARFQRYFDDIQQDEIRAADFKVELRHGIHLALWHAMVACTDRAEAERLMHSLGGMMLALIERMPLIGWRLVADALAHMQIRLLAQDGTLAQETTQQLFDALRQALPLQRHHEIQAAAAQAVMAWQQSRRPA